MKLNQYFPANIGIQALHCLESGCIWLTSLPTTRFLLNRADAPLGKCLYHEGCETQYTTPLKSVYFTYTIHGFPPQEEEHGVLVGNLLDQPHVMRQDGLAALVPAPTPTYERQVVNLSFELCSCFQERVDEEASDCRPCSCILSARDNHCSSRLE